MRLHSIHLGRRLCSVLIEQQGRIARLYLARRNAEARNQRLVAEHHATRSRAVQRQADLVLENERLRATVDEQARVLSDLTAALYAAVGTAEDWRLCSEERALAAGLAIRAEVEVV